MTDATVLAWSNVRGKSKQRNWKRPGDAESAVIRLEVDVSAPAVRHRVESMFSGAWQVRQAVQRQARSRVDAYWTAYRLRAAEGPKVVRARFGLSRTALEQAAYEHVDESGWLRDHVTKAVAMHVADEVWQSVDRHLFPDTTGKTMGRPQVGSWRTSTRIPGRARSHTKPRVWETFRLVGSLTAHRQAYPGRGLDGSVITQPQRLPVPVRPAGQSGWWAYDGPMTVVFTGLGSDLVLPVRLPQSAGQQARLDHFLADPQMWHKVDLVRVEDSKAPGGWRYYAHLMILGAGWTSPVVTAERLLAPRLMRRPGRCHAGHAGRRRTGSSHRPSTATRPRPVPAQQQPDRI